MTDAQMWETTEDRIFLRQALASLKNERSRQVLLMRYFARMTLEDVGIVLGISRERARQIDVEAIRQLRKFAEVQDILKQQQERDKAAAAFEDARRKTREQSEAQRKRERLEAANRVLREQQRRQLEIRRGEIREVNARNHYAVREPFIPTPICWDKIPLEMRGEVTHGLYGDYQ